MSREDLTDATRDHLELGMGTFSMAVEALHFGCTVRRRGWREGVRLRYSLSSPNPIIGASDSGWKGKWQPYLEDFDGHDWEFAP